MIYHKHVSDGKRKILIPRFEKKNFSNSVDHTNTRTSRTLTRRKNTLPQEKRQHLYFSRQLGCTNSIFNVQQTNKVPIRLNNSKPSDTCLPYCHPPGCFCVLLFRHFQILTKVAPDAERSKSRISIKKNHITVELKI